MIHGGARLLAIAAAAWLADGQLRAEPLPDPLTGAEVERARTIEAAGLDAMLGETFQVEGLDRPQRPLLRKLRDVSAYAGTKALTPSRDGSEVVAIGPVLPLPGDRARRAVVSRYFYARGVTAHSYVDLGEGKIVARTLEVNAPTPLVEAEIVRALEIARKANAELGAALSGARPPDLRIQASQVIYNDEEHERYAHRLAAVTVGIPGRDAALGPYLVDLSMDELTPD
jgi:hypothetical protein